MSNEFNRCTFNFQKIALTSAIICMSIFQEEGINHSYEISYFLFHATLRTEDQVWIIENRNYLIFCHARLQSAGLWLCVKSP